MTRSYIVILSFLTLAVGLFIVSCTQEQQNKISRSIQNWTGTQGVLDVFSQGKILYRIIHIDKLSTATATSMNAGGVPRPYRFGYGVMDRNFNYIQDEGEVKTYFEFSDYSTPYLFYENPLATVSSAETSSKPITTPTDSQRPDSSDNPL